MTVRCFGYHKIIFSIVICALLLCGLTVYAGALDMSGAAVEYGDTFIGDGAELNYGASWTAGAGLREATVVTGTAYGERCEFMRAFPDSGLHYVYSATCGFDSVKNLYLRSAVVVQLSVMDSTGSADGGYFVEVSVDGGIDRKTASQIIGSDKWYTVSVDISDFDYRYAVSSVTVSVRSDDSDSSLSGFRVRGIYASGTADVENESRFICREYTGENCRVSNGENGCILRPSQNETAGFQNISVYSTIPVCSLKQPRANILRVALVNRTANTSMTVISGQTTSTVSIEPNAAQQIYYAAAEYAQGEQLRIVFSGAQDDSGYIALSSVTFLYIPKDNTDSASLGSLTSLTRTGADIRVRGTVTADTAAKYIGGQIELYRVECSEDTADILPDAKPLYCIKMTTRFDFTVTLPQIADAQQSRFIVAINDNGQRYFLSQARFAMPVQSAAAQTAASQSAQKGMELTDSSYIPLDEGLSTAVVDVYCDRLVSENKQSYGSVVLFSRAGVWYYFNSDYTAELDRTVRELSSTGTRITLRLLIADEMEDEALTYPGVSGSVYYAPDTSDKSGVNQWCAVVDYLASRYNGTGNGTVSGFIAGGAANDVHLNRTGDIEMQSGEYFRAYTDALCLLYNVASEHIEGVSVYAAMCTSVTESEFRAALLCNNYNGTNASFIELPLFVRLLYASLENSGSIKAGVYALCNDSGEAFDVLTSAYATFSSAMRSVPSQSASGSLILTWQTTALSPQQTAKSYADAYAALADVSGKIKLESIVLRVSDADAAYKKEMASVIKTADSSVRTLYQTEAAAVSGSGADVATDANIIAHSGNFKGSYTLFDFTAAYDSHGWFAGTGCGSVSTRRSVAAGERVLRADLENTAANSPDSYFMVLTDELELSCAPIVYITLAADKPVSLSVIFGDGANRAEFSLTAGTQMQTYAMDLTESGIADSVGYIMIHAYDAYTGHVDVMNLTLNSLTHTSEAINDTLIPAPAAVPETRNIRETAGIIIFAVVIALSILAIALTSKPKRA